MTEERQERKEVWPADHPFCMKYRVALMTVDGVTPKHVFCLPADHMEIHPTGTWERLRKVEAQ